MKISELLSYNMERLRTAQGLTKTELADRCGISRKHIGNVELAHAYPREDTLMSIAKGLGVDVSELVVSPDYREQRIQAIYEAFQELEKRCDDEARSKKEEELMELLKNKL